MALQTREYALTKEGGGVTRATYEFDDVTGQLMALVLTGDVNARSAIGASNPVGSVSDGLKDQAVIRINVSADDIFLIVDPEDGDWILPPDTKLSMAVFSPKVDAARVTRERGRLRPRGRLR